MTQPALLDAALDYARRGLRVFPCWPILPILPPQTGFLCGCGKLTCEHQGKHPLGALAPKGLSNASADETKVRHWWTTRPDANVAIATGPVVVLDVDPRHHGDASLAELERKHGAMPATARVRTGGAGLHVYLQPPPGITIKNSIGKLAPGLDVRGAGGYVLAPPSRHVSGNRYQWISGGRGCATMPAWLVTALQESTCKQAASPDSWRTLVRDGVCEGERNNALARLAGHLLRHYVDPHVTLELLIAWNASRCRPPLPPGEITTIVNSIAQRELARRQSQ
jgi:bifunctional DNA primase/polymerase-like protein/primase-like protein